MEYISTYSKSFGWRIAKIFNHQPTPLSEAEIDQIVKALNTNEQFVKDFLTPKQDDSAQTNISFKNNHIIF